MQNYREAVLFLAGVLFLRVSALRRDIVLRSCYSSEQIFNSRQYEKKIKIFSHKQNIELLKPLQLRRGGGGQRMNKNPLTRISPVRCTYSCSLQWRNSVRRLFIKVIAIICPSYCRTGCSSHDNKCDDVFM